ncbi:hypothetical protein LEN26_008130 [Aphanomyces euteiches]|nr:hypothetical protein AeMF1_000630 [Aphanomyces euteiches]KAH9130838.1 hypothetical protein LEN26_008130 [Aphanomyces euteiches]KAH9187006.1 hypothetical protein AeNC1_011016 [Aphanomyces euteiches]
MELEFISMWNVFVVVLGLFLLAVATAMLYFFVISHAFHPLNAIPGPPSSHWFYGAYKDIMDTKWSDGHFPEPALSWVKKYGGAVHYRAVFGHRVMLTDPEAIKHVFVTHSDNYPRSNGIRNFLRDLVGGDGLLSTEGETHQHQRKMLMPHFGFGKIKDFINVFAHHAGQLSRHLNQVVDEDVAVDMHEFFTKLTLDIIGVASFGYNFGSLDNSNERVIQAYNMMNQPPNILYGVAALLIPGFRNWPLPRLVQIREAKRILFDTVDNVIAAKLKAPRDTSRPIDLVDLMLDTTSSTLCWVFAMFATQPEMEALARKECQAVAAASDGDIIGWKSLGELKYTTAFIQETLRLHPTITIITPRACVQDDHVPMSDGKSIFITKGANMVVVTGPLHRNPKDWSQPDEFVPERFLEGTAPFEADKALRNGQGNSYTYLPFSTGPKNCIGMRFAMAELQVVISNLLLQFSFRLTDKANVNPRLDGVSLKPVHLSMTIHSVAASSH